MFILLHVIILECVDCSQIPLTRCWYVHHNELHTYQLVLNYGFKEEAVSVACNCTLYENAQCTIM